MAHKFCQKRAANRRGRPAAAVLMALLLFFMPSLGGLDLAHAEYTPPVQLQSKGVYLINLDSDMVIYQKNASQKMYPSWLTMIMTAILVMENVEDLDSTVVTANQWMFDEFYGYSVPTAGIQAGEELSMRQLLYCMLLQSSCEAANVAAYYVGDESILHFVDMMNEKAVELGAVNTHFENPHGMQNEKQVTTPYDIYRIARYAMDIPGFMDIVNTTVYSMEDTNMVTGRTLVNSNYLLSQYQADGAYYYAPTSGIKNGGSRDAGRSLVSTAQQNGMNYMLVLMGAPMYDEGGTAYPENFAYSETKALYQWVYDTFSVKVLLKQNEPVDEVKLSLAWDKDYLLLMPEKSFSALVPNDIDPESVQKVAVLPEEGVMAPVAKGDVIGSVKLILAGEQVGQVDLVAAEDVSRSELLFLLHQLGNFFTSLPFWLCVGVLAFALIGYTVYTVVRNGAGEKTKYPRSKRKKR